jgi:hypothetical protein
MRMKSSWAMIGVVTVLFALGGCAQNTAVTGAGGLSGQAPSIAPGVPTGSATATNSATATATKTATHTATHVSSPAIDSFVVSQQPMCPVIATSASPQGYPGVDIKLKWHVTGATKVALSLDDKNFFKEHGSGSQGDYATTGEADLPFECDATAQPDTTHTYTLDTIGGGPTAQQTLSVTERTSP